MPVTVAPDGMVVVLSPAKAHAATVVTVVTAVTAVTAVSPVTPPSARARAAAHRQQRLLPGGPGHDDLVGGTDVRSGDRRL